MHCRRSNSIIKILLFAQDCSFYYSITLASIYLAAGINLVEHRFKALDLAVRMKETRSERLFPLHTKETESASL